MGFKIRILIIFQLNLLLSCNSDSTLNSYSGYYYETKWTYIFKANGEYHLLSDGHLGDRLLESGKYHIQDEVIVLFKNQEINDKFEILRFYMDGDGRLVDILGNRYFKNLTKYSQTSFYRCHSEFEKSLSIYIDSLVSNSDIQTMAYISGCDTTSYKSKFIRISKVNNSIYDVYGCTFFEEGRNEVSEVNSCTRYVDIDSKTVYLMNGDSLYMDDQFKFHCLEN